MLYDTFVTALSISRQGQSLGRKKRMQITDIKIRKTFDDDGPMKAIASVTFDHELALHDIKVIYAKEKLFIVMPSRKNSDGLYRDIAHPISAKFRAMLETAVLEAYNAAKEAEATQDEQE